MENESKLIKDWKERDVQRMRNIITKKHGDKTVTQVGYTKPQIDHKEGDIWEENGKKWTVKSGIKQTITRFDELKKAVMLPLVCPKCTKPMNVSHANKKMWSIHRMCLNCVVDMETKLKKDNKYQEYEKNMIINGIRTHIKELEAALLDISLNSNNESYVTEAGDIEQWKGNDDVRQRIITELTEYIQKLKEATDS
jgi:hypothetical protein